MLLAAAPVRSLVGPFLRSAVLGSFLLAPWGCRPSAEEAPETTSEQAAAEGSATSLFVRIEDDAGRSVAFGQPPVRMVSLVPSGTEILLALGQRDHLVGRTDYDDDPAVADLPSVGGGLAPSIERIVSLGPDLVIYFWAESDPTTPRQLEQSGIPSVAIRPDGISDVHRIIQLLGTIVGRRAMADSLSGSLAAQVDAVSASVAGLDRPPVAFLLGGDPPLVAGPGTFLDELISIAGGRNVFSDAGALYAPVNVEEVIRREPRYILAREGAGIPATLARIPVLRLPPEVESPGLGLGESAGLIARGIHPGPLP